VTEDGSSETSGRLLTHQVPVYALSWLQSYILAAGCDKKIVFYDSRGKSVKVVDYSKNSEEKEMSVACCSPSGQSVAIGSWNKVFLLTFFIFS
jgi:intraflagellar transport protein 172